MNQFNVIQCGIEEHSGERCVFAGPFSYETALEVSRKAADAQWDNIDPTKPESAQVHSYMVEPARSMS